MKNLFLASRLSQWEEKVMSIITQMKHKIGELMKTDGLIKELTLSTGKKKLDNKNI